MGFDYEGTKSLFDLIWTYFTSWTIPVINLTPATFIVSMIVLGLILRVLSGLLGLGTGAISFGFHSAISDIKSDKDFRRWASDRRKGGRL